MNWFTVGIWTCFLGIILSARHGHLTMDPSMFGRGKTKKQMWQGAAGCYIFLAIAIILIMWREA